MQKIIVYKTVKQWMVVGFFCFVVFLFLNQSSTFKQTTQVDQSVLQSKKKKCSLGAEYVPSLHHDT